MQYTVNINLANESYTFTPTHYFIVHDNGLRDNHVIMYRLIYKKSGDNRHIIEANIPYYISDGHTNGFRANMLYPFICFSLLDDDSCPYAPQYTNGLLLKYEIATNVNTNELQRYVNERYSEKVRTPTLAKIKDDSNSGTSGVSSVLGRIKNIIDYIISMCSTTILNVDQNFDIRYCRPVSRRGSELDMNYFTPGDKDDLDLYRGYLLQVLNNQIQGLIKYGYCTIERKSLDSINTTRSRFNNYINISRNSKGNIENVARYAQISINLRHTFELYTNYLIKKNPNDWVLKFRGLLKSNTTTTSPNLFDLLRNNIQHWTKIEWKPIENKYLKYKNKYINLKKYNYMKEIYNLLVQKYDNVMITGSWAVYIYANEYNKDDTNKDKIKLKDIDPQDIDFIFYTTDKHQKLFEILIKEINIGDYKYITKQISSKSKTFTSDNTLIKSFDIINSYINPKNIITIDNINLLSISQLAYAYKEAFVLKEDKDKFKRHYKKIDIINKMLKYNFVSHDEKAISYKSNYSSYKTQTKSNFSLDESLDELIYGTPKKSKSSPNELRYETPPKSRYESPKKSKSSPNELRYESPNKSKSSPNELRYESPKKSKSSPNELRYETPPKSKSSPNELRYESPKKSKSSPHELRYETPPKSKSSPNELRYESPRKSKSSPNKLRYETPPKSKSSDDFSFETPPKSKSSDNFSFETPPKSSYE